MAPAGAGGGGEAATNKVFDVQMDDVDGAGGAGDEALRGRADEFHGDAQPDVAEAAYAAAAAAVADGDGSSQSSSSTLSSAAAMAGSPPRPGSPVLIGPPPARITCAPDVATISRRGSVHHTSMRRAASIGTQEALDEVTNPVTQPRPPITDKIRRVFRNPSENAAYLKSMDFAQDIIELSAQAGAIFEQEARLLKLQSPIYVFGDVHGNLADLHYFSNHIWNFGMELTAGSFLFLGDYVDRGQYGLEVIAYLFSQKLAVRDKLFLIRGNHELRAVNGWVEHYQRGSFLWQCQNRFGDEVGANVWEAVNDAFDRLPLAATIDDSVFCVHGGIPRLTQDDMPASAAAGHGGGGGGGVRDVRLQTIEQYPCPATLTPPNRDEHRSLHVALDLLWADPADQRQEDAALDVNGFGPSSRGDHLSCFGTHAVKTFCDRYGFSFVIRAHQAVASGIQLSKGARVFTVFSTSKDHGCGDEATCGVILIENGVLRPITRGRRK